MNSHPRGHLESGAVAPTIRRVHSVTAPILLTVSLHGTQSLWFDVAAGRFGRGTHHQDSKIAVSAYRGAEGTFLTLCFMGLYDAPKRTCL